MARIPGRGNRVNEQLPPRPTGELAAGAGLLACGVPPRTAKQAQLEERVGNQLAALVAIQASLLRHYFRLQTLERLISARAHPSGRSGPAAAIRMVEMERRRVSLELHTGVGQLLAAIRLQIEVAQAQLDNPPQAASQALQRIDMLASDALEQVRSVSRRLHPPEWQRLTLQQALGQLWALSGVPEKYAARLRIELEGYEPELEQKVLIYRAAQEALSNLVRHSHATEIEMALEVRGNEIVLTISDNGVGFDVSRLRSEPASVSSGIGLRAIREQASSAGGKFLVESGPVGTKLKVSVPLSPEKA